MTHDIACGIDAAGHLARHIKHRADISYPAEMRQLSHPGTSHSCIPSSHLRRSQLVVNAGMMQHQERHPLKGSVGPTFISSWAACMPRQERGPWPKVKLLCFVSSASHRSGTKLLLSRWVPALSFHLSSFTDVSRRKSQSTEFCMQAGRRLQSA